MASSSDEGEKWKRKRMLCARAEKIRATKKMRLEEAKHGDCETHNQDASREGLHVS